MRRKRQPCSITGCGNLCWWNRPFCASCWRDIPRDVRAAVVDELAKYVGDEDVKGLRLALAAAVESVQYKPAGSGYWFWECVYLAAGAPRL